MQRLVDLLIWVKIIEMFGERNFMDELLGVVCDWNVIGSVGINTNHFDSVDWLMKSDVIGW